MRAGDGIGYSGHKHQKGEKIIAIVDNKGRKARARKNAR
jgi:hypothetical protein